MAADCSKLPFIDEPNVLVRAPASTVWAELGRTLRGQTGLAQRAVALLLGAEACRADGDPLSAGATLPGFSVAAVVPGSRLVLAGRHRFSEYVLIFALTPQDGTTRLSARTHARFPGLRGRAYRALVIGSGGHRYLVAGMLQSIRRAAESRVSS